MSDKTAKPKKAKQEAPAGEKKHARKPEEAKAGAKAAPHEEAKQKKIEVQAEIHKEAGPKMAGAQAAKPEGAGPKMAGTEERPDAAVVQEAKPEEAKAGAAEEKAPAGGFRGQKKVSGKTEEKKEKKILEERVYTIPFYSVMKSTRTKRANKAVRVVKKFISRHMHSDNVKISADLNERLWSRGIQKPPRRLRVKALKYEDSVVAELMA